LKRQPKDHPVTPLQIVEACLVPHARKLHGSMIVDVSYCVLECEASNADNLDNDFYFGGECRLTLGESECVYVSWNRLAKWSDDTHYSLSLGLETLFSPDSLTELSANIASAWSPHIGKQIEGVRLLGIDGVPFVLSLETAAGFVFLGSSFQTKFGDGDDVFATANPETVLSMSTIWQSGPNTFVRREL
jgi:hypothetical protein